jgi:hypothetical protein
MLALKRLSKATGAAIALAITISGGANANPWSPAIGWGVGPDNNGWGLRPGMWGVNPQQGTGTNFGVGGQRWFWGTDPQQGNGMWTSNPPQWGINPYFPLWGMSPQQNVGFGPFPHLGMNAPYPSLPAMSVYPQQNLGPWGHWPGANPQQNFGPYPYPYFSANPQYPPLPAMNITGPQMQQPQQAGTEPIHCSINGVAALTKSVNDCEKAGGETVKRSVATNNKK